jgi:hypothetical protein
MIVIYRKGRYNHPCSFMADVAQLVRASVCGTEGRGFKSHHSPQEETLQALTLDR